jgi:hypothetical protein
MAVLEDSPQTVGYGVSPHERSIVGRGVLYGIRPVFRNVFRREQ